MKVICKFCKKKTNHSFDAYNYYNNYMTGKFYKCCSCKVMIQPKKIKGLYNKQDSTNYNLKKNFFYFLKKIILNFFIFDNRDIFLKKKNLLDYGCGSGELAIALSSFYKDKNIYTADVFDLHKKFIPNVKKHYLLNKNQLKGKKFDVILMRHVFEHIYDLSKFIKKIKNNFKNNDSCLVIEVPNLDSFWRKIMKKRWPGYFYPFHYYVFSKYFLRNLLNQNRLCIVKEKALEPPILGLYLLSFGFNKSLSKFLSLIFYPIQFLVSKIFLTSEAILIVVKKK